VLTIRLTTLSDLRLARASRRMRVRPPWPSFVALTLALIGISLGIALALHFTLHTASDLDTNGHGAPSHQCPADHINVLHNGLRDSQAISERVSSDAACAPILALEQAAPRYFDEAPVRAPVSAEYTSILSARGPPARP